MLKKTIAILILIFTISTNAYATTDILTIDDAIGKIDSTYTINLFDYSITRLTNNHKSLSDIVQMYPVSLLFSMDSQTLCNLGLPFTNKDKLEQAKFVYIQPDQLLSTISMLKDNKAVTINSLKLGAMNLYNSIVMLNEAISIQQESADISKMQLQSATEKYNNGTISQSDLNKKILDNQKNELNLSIQKRKLQNLKYSLNKMLSNDIDYDFDVEYELKVPDKFGLKGNVQEYINCALENRTEIKNINEDIKNIDKEIFFTNVFYGEKETEYKIAQLKKMVAEEKLLKTKDEIYYEIESAYDDVYSKFYNIEKVDINYQNAMAKYNDTKAKFDSGLITKDILDSVGLMVRGEKLNLITAVNDYNSSLNKFKLATGIGPKYN